jgi:thiosulfate dehydrogenase
MEMRSPRILACALLVATIAIACNEPPPPPPAEWAPPAESEIPNDAFGASIRRGLALMRATPESLPAYATSNLRCTSCHQQDGRRSSAMPLFGMHAKYPMFMPRTGAVVTLHDRINYCMTRSLAGNALPSGSREMADMVAYLAFLSRGIELGGKLPSAGLKPMKDTLVGDIARGTEVYRGNCVACHGVDGGGAVPGVPALWGPKSFAIGASMAREERAASFIHQNMPLDKPGTLTPQQAFDVAAFVNSHERPDSPGKEGDFPGGDAPKDVPYATKGHVASRPPARLLPRANPAGATVPAPPSVLRRAN